MGNGVRWLVAMAVAIAAVAGWGQRARLQSWWSPPSSASRPADNPDVLYTWVDKEGVTHFEQQSGKGMRVEYDGSRITPLEPVAPAIVAKARAAAEGAEAGSGDAIRNLRRELVENARRMQEARAASNDL